ncbi:MAG: nitrophenyl compound nitroreductase subunit ArsF family protein [Candidatus Omnitrophica bacterium]|nr:nitrophenyl compound nitroreductase subunit ArsF family protein [Candidatus Omnitrophota bacterium]
MKRIFLIFFIVWVSLDFISPLCADNQPSGKVIVYYFRGTSRSPSCRDLERNCKEAIETEFKGALASGKLEFQVVILGNNGEGYYAGYYKVCAKTLILSLVKSGKEVKWKDLDKIIEYAENKAELSDYIQSEISGLLGEIE